VLVPADVDNEAINLARRIEPVRPWLETILEDPDGAF
jgi:hypothetical protein